MPLEKMSATEARTFDRYSVGNAALVMIQRGCGCEPYRDVFTYNRWKAQGFQVQKGEKSIRLPHVRIVTVKDQQTGEEVQRRSLRSSAVFCRCQVQERN